MNLKKVMHFGRMYIVFARGRQFRGRVLRIERAFVDLACGASVTRLGAREVKAVLEPSVATEAQFMA